jgi:hypothetical protein
MKTKKKPRKLLRWLLIAVGLLLILFLLLFVAFVWNPFEGTLRDLRDLVPREVDFFGRKTDLADDFAEFPAPAFWPELTGSLAWQQLEKGPLVQSAKRSGIETSLQQLRDGMQRVASDSGGLLDAMRDIAGREVVVAGYYEDRSKKPPVPLAQPRWCMWARVSWRVCSGWGIARWGLVQGQLGKHGVELANDGELLTVKAAGAAGTFYAARHLDCLMVANDRGLIEQSLRLAAGAEGEEPFGQWAAYTDGVVARVQRWADVNMVEYPNSLEVSVAPNSLDAFRQFAARWPDAQDRDSMNNRVLARFLKLAGWTSLSGAFVFEPERLSFMGQVVLNGNLHTDFQSNFFRAEKQPRKDWLDPFLRMVPESACAAAALRMPVGEFLRAMYGALLDKERELLNSGIARCVLQGQQITDFSDLIERLTPAFLPRAGFVFRRNVRDTEIKVADLSPMPQVAWVFWIKDGSTKLLEDFVEMLLRNAAAFKFHPVYNLPIKPLPDNVVELCNPQIPATGEIAMIVFREFFVVSNSGPLIKEILKTKYGADGLRSIVETDAFRSIQDELPTALNGFVWLKGANLVPLFEEYRATAERAWQDPDPGWMAENRSRVEEVVRLARFADQYPSKAAMPPQLTEPGGAFDQAVVQKLREEWAKIGTGLTKDDLAKVDQFKAMAELMDAAYLQLDLENSYIRYQGKILARFQ